MRSIDNNTQAFFALVRAGLWEKDVRLLPYQDIKWQIVYELASEQTVLGLVLAGLEHSDVKPQKELLLQWIGEVQLLEQRNKAMNGFVEKLIGRLEDAGIRALLVKGQGIAQCYERPQWRAPGDVDLLLNKENYDKAKAFLTHLSKSLDSEDEGPMHMAMFIDNWEVELHGTLHSGLRPRYDQFLDNIQKQVIEDYLVRIWRNGSTDVILPRADEDVVFVFAHILQHFFKGGIGLRQVCDWCRLLWTYKDLLDHGLLESRIRMMGFMTEWKAFASLGVNMLGMPEDVMPFYSSAIKWQHKAERILDFILETGNFGYNRENRYFEKKSLLGRKNYSFWRHTSDSVRHFFIFPRDSFLIWCNMVNTGIRAILKHQ